MTIVAAFAAALLSTRYVAAGRLLVIVDYRKWYPFCGGFEKMKRQTSNKKEEALIAPSFSSIF
ncbi:hypothetical protein QMA09_15965 [Planococcus sp. APC 3906]|uniref:hypothetical protein n=1 Tax=Planococcus sp. APC 3906 TaxID=3035194 RepID=UPI0025B382CC|nr:hypothetical protein [Planococcus sp. APC 3906]MDN3451695.1 hypothetical protein [Planococcus sp. APC 3906]